MDDINFNLDEPQVTFFSPYIAIAAIGTWFVFLALNI